MLVILRATAPPDPHAFATAAHRALAALSTRPGYLSGRIARALDDPARWVVTCEWADVGSGRRGLASADVRADIMPLMIHIDPEPTAFEIICEGRVAPGPAVRDVPPDG